MKEPIKSNISKIIADAIDFVNSKNEFHSYESHKIDFDLLKNIGVVYFVFEGKILKYVGKSKGIYFKQRLKNHFEGAHNKTSTVNGKINKCLKKVEFSFLLTKPESLRSVIEEELINHFKDIEKLDLWNGKNNS